MTRRDAAGARAVLFCLMVALAAWAGAARPAYAQTPEEAPDVEMLWELMVMTRAPEGVQVVHLMHVANMGPRVATAVPLAVPEGARWVEAPATLILDEGAAVDPEPLAVGEQRRYMVVYEIPWQRLPMAVRRPILYPTHEVDLWVRPGELELRGVGLQAGGRAQFEGVEVETYRMTDLQPHPAWQVVLDSPLSGSARLLAEAPLGQRSDPVDILRTHPAPRWILGALAVIGLAAVVRRLLPDRSVGARGEGAAPDGPAAAGASSRLAHEIELLKEEIVRADVAFESGELDEETYRLRRGELKERLVALMSAQKPAGGERR